MAIDSTGAGPSLSALLDQAQRHQKAALSPNDTLLFSGNPHESVPRALFLDTRLTPLERNAWQVFRLQLNPDGLTVFPTYEQLRPFLASMPCGPKASTETVARALTILRLTRWLSLVQRRRDRKTGCLLGNLYVLHDEPLTPFEAMQLDPEYLGLVSQALTHASKAIQYVTYQILREISEDPLLSGRVLPTRLQVMTQRLAAQGWANNSPENNQDWSNAHTSNKTYPQTPELHESEAGLNDPLRNRGASTSDSEMGRQPPSHHALRNPKVDGTVRINNKKLISTVPRAHEVSIRERLQLPHRFTRLKDEQQSGALITLQQVDPALQQLVLDEWDARCRLSSVRNPAGYLFGIIQKALRGEFNAWLGHSTPGITSTSPSGFAITPDEEERAQQELVQEEIARLRNFLRMT